MPWTTINRLMVISPIKRDDYTSLGAQVKEPTEYCSLHELTGHELLTFLQNHPNAMGFTVVIRSHDGWSFARSVCLGNDGEEGFIHIGRAIEK